MRFGIHTMDDFSLKGKTVLVRVDMNQPVDHETGTLKNTNRIAACVPTILELMEKGAKIVLMAHQGSDIEYHNFYTTEPHAKVLSEMLDCPIGFVDDVCGPAARQAIRSLEDGQVLLLDNVRFVSEEQTLFEKALKLDHDAQAKTLLVRKLAPLADVFVCDAFAAAHRDQPSICAFPKVLPSAMGRLFEKEYCILSELLEEPEQPCVFVLGGAKVQDAFLMLKTVLKKGAVHKVLTGGLVANILLWAAGAEIGQKSRAFISDNGYAGLVETGKELLAKFADKIMLPQDVAAKEGETRAEYSIGEIPSDCGILDIGSVTSQKYKNEIENAATVFVNGPMGVFEDAQMCLGTESIWKALADTKAFTVVGGGDSVTAASRFGVKEQIGYICTGGGAMIRFLTGEELPAVAALREAAQKNP